jgi:hypothetical protein
LLVRSEIAVQQQKAETPPEPRPGPTPPGPTPPGPSPVPPEPVSAPKRFHGTVTLDPTRVGGDAGRVADEVIAHLAGLVGSTVTVTLDIDARISSGAPDHVVRTVTENSRTLKFTAHGFESE